MTLVGFIIDHYSVVPKQEIDAIAPGMIATPERNKMVDFAYFYWAEPHAMVVPRPGEEPRLLAFIQPFQPIVIISAAYIELSAGYPYII